MYFCNILVYLEDEHMKYGYIRVSTTEQNTDRQHETLDKICDCLFEEKISGKDMNRPELLKLLDTVKSGDEIIVHELDRLGRKGLDLLTMIDGLKNKGVRVICLEDSIDSFDDSKTILLYLKCSLAEEERLKIKKRQAEGIAQAKKRGVYKQSNNAYKDEDLLRSTLYLYSIGQIKQKEVCSRLGISRSTLWRMLKRGE